MKKDWTYKKLGEVCRIERGGSPRPIKDYITNDVKGLNWIKIGDTDPEGKYIYSTKEKIKPEGLKKSRWVEENEFLLSNSMSFGRPYILKTNGCIHDGWLVLRDYQELLNIDFFYYTLISPHVQNQFRTKAQGSTVSNLNTDRVSDVNIAFPSLSEQSRIVSRLDAAFGEIEGLKAKAEAQLREARTLFQAALTQEMKPKQGWEEKKLKEIGTTQTGTTPSKTDKDNYGDFIPFIRPSEIDYDGCGSIKYDSEIKLSEKGLSNGRLFKAGSILMVCIGATISKVGVTSEDVSCNQQINVLNSKQEYDSKFIYFAMRNEDFKQKVIKEGTSSQATLPIINKGKWENLSLSLPPLPVQQSIVSRLDALSEKVRELEEAQKKVIAECDALKQALLREVFE